MLTHHGTRRGWSLLLGNWYPNGCHDRGCDCLWHGSRYRGLGGGREEEGGGREVRSEKEGGTGQDGGREGSYTCTYTQVYSNCTCMCARFYKNCPPSVVCVETARW